MATIAALLQMPTPSSIPQVRHRDTPEVIDVDSFIYEPSNVPEVGARPARRRRLNTPPTDTAEVIAIMDSDEEGDQQVAGPSRVIPGSIRRERSFRHFSPPPPPQAGPSRQLPPVPRLSEHFHPFRSLPMRRHPPRDPSGNPIPSDPPGAIQGGPVPVRPSTEPFPFERDSQPGPLPGIMALFAREPPPLRAAPPSHHLPSMGLGGALISQYRQYRDSHGRRSAATTRRRPADLTYHDDDTDQGETFLRRVARYAHTWIPGDQHAERRTMPSYHDWLFDDVAQPYGDYLDDDDAIFERLAEFGRGRPNPSFTDDVGRARAKREKEEIYLPEYTHPEKPTPGFTFDFGAPDYGSSNAASSSKSADEATTILVCAMCLDPLVLGGGDDGRQKLWGLRCGHMLDGKCVGKLSKPEAALLFVTPPPLDIKGKGKAKEVDISMSTIQAEPPESELPITLPPLEPHVTRDGVSLTMENAPESILSRLRPRTSQQSLSSIPTPATTDNLHSPEPPDYDMDNNNDGDYYGDLVPGYTPRRRNSRRFDASASTFPGLLPDDSSHTVHSRPRRPLPKRRGGGRKPKVKGPVVEATHEWRCPVTGCGRLHTALLIGGVWTQDPEKGAIGIYA